MALPKPEADFMAGDARVVHQRWPHGPWRARARKAVCQMSVSCNTHEAAMREDTARPPIQPLLHTAVLASVTQLCSTYGTRKDKQI